MSRPEDRYKNLTKMQLTDGRWVYRSAIPLTVDDTKDFDIVANETDRMDVIAYKIFGTAMDWWKIAAANKKVNGSLFLTPGQKIVIPKV